LSWKIRECKGASRQRERLKTKKAAGGGDGHVWENRGKERQRWGDHEKKEKCHRTTQRMTRKWKGETYHRAYRLESLIKERISTGHAEKSKKSQKRTCQIGMEKRLVLSRGEGGMKKKLSVIGCVKRGRRETGD